MWGNGTSSLEHEDHDLGVSDLDATYSGWSRRLGDRWWMGKSAGAAEMGVGQAICKKISSAI